MDDPVDWAGFVVDPKKWQSRDGTSGGSDEVENPVDWEGFHVDPFMWKNEHGDVPPTEGGMFDINPDDLKWLASDGIDVSELSHSMPIDVNYDYDEGSGDYDEYMYDNELDAMGAMLDDAINHPADIDVVDANHYSPPHYDHVPTHAGK